MAGSDPKKEAKRQSARPASGGNNSRVSKAAGSQGSPSVQSMKADQRAGSSANVKQSGRGQVAKQISRGKQEPSQSAANAQHTKKSPVRQVQTPLVSPPDPKDVTFIKWVQEKWHGLEAHQQQQIFGSVLLLLSLLLFASLTIFNQTPIFQPLYQGFLVFFGWSSYLLAIGLIAFALAHLIEGMRKQRLIRWSMVVGLLFIWLLLLIESRLIINAPTVGVLAELLVRPLLGWPVAVQHMLTLGLLLIALIFTFRITFGHILMVAHAIQRMTPSRHEPTAAEKTRERFLGQRPRFSRYTASSMGIASEAKPARSGKRPVEDDEDLEDEDEETIAFEADFDEDDPLNDINIHKQQVGLVPRGSRVPQMPDPASHKAAVQGVSQQALPFDASAPAQGKKKNAKQQQAMEPLAPNPLLLNQKQRGAAPAPLIASIWKLPDIGLLNSPETTKLHMMGDDTEALARTIQETLRSFRVDAEVRQEDISIGPTVIRFGIRPTGKPELIKDEKTGKMVPVRDAAGNIIYEVRTRVSRIMALQNDLALVLEAKTIRMEAPVPGRPYVGVEIPNKNSRLVTLREVLESKEYLAAKAKSKIAIGLGKDVAGLVRVGDLARMPHLLIAGATGAGKCLAHDEPVFLADGRIVKVQELLGQTVEVIGVKDTKTMHQTPVLATFTDNGTQEVFEIELDNGIILRRTGEHPLWAACLDENQHVGRQANGKATRRTRAIGADWVQTKDLRVCGNRPDFDGHVVLCPLSLKQHGTVSHSDADVILCAVLLAEGTLNKTGRSNLSGKSLGTPRFTNADAGMVELVGTAVRAYGCQLVVSPHKVKGDIDYYISQVPRGTRNSKNPVAQLVCDWKINGLATQKIIPEWVFYLPNEQIALFLRVFTDCDGWVSVRGHRSSVSVSLANPVLVQQIGQLAMRLGITGTYTKKENGFAGAWTWSTTMVTEWQEQVGSLIKSEKLALAVTDQKNSRECAATVWNAWRRAYPQTGQRFSNCPQGYEWRKIVAIRHTIAPTINIEVHSDNHAFVGYAVEHNSVCVNTIIASILTQATPDDVRLLMVDPKMVELNMYGGIPHLLSPVVTEVERVVPLLKNAINEMERRYRLFSQLGVRNLDGYRKLRLEKFSKGDTSLNNLPAIVIIIDELADLMMAAPEEVEGMICRLAQLARATGIHLVVATQRPSVDVITGLIKANIPTRISFMVSSSVDSRTIIDMGGAERLLGRGDMLYLPADAGRPERIQGSFLADEEAEALVAYWRQQVEEYQRQLAAAQPAQEEQPASLPAVEPGWEIVEHSSDDLELDDELLEKAEEVVREYGRASISLLQRRLRVGYSRAARLIDLLEEHGIIGQFEPGGKAREVLEGNGDYDRRAGDGHTLADEVADIVAEERARNEFLRKQAANQRTPRQQNDDA